MSALQAAALSLAILSSPALINRIIARRLERLYEDRAFREDNPARPPLFEGGGPFGWDELQGMLASLPRGHRDLGSLNTPLSSMPDLYHLLRSALHLSPDTSYPYPGCFRRVTIKGEGGVPLIGLLALHEDGIERMGLVFVHDIPGHKNCLYLLLPAIHAFSRWGFNVLVFDQRYCGESSRVSERRDAPDLWGGRDLREVSRWLGDHPMVNGVGICGFGMGGSAALLAAGDGGLPVSGVMSFNPPLPPFDPLSSPQTSLPDPGLGRTLQAINRSLMRRIFHDNMDAYRRYLYSSPPSNLVGINLPALVLHTMDDPITTGDNAFHIMGITEDNPWVFVLPLRRGGHHGLHLVDPAWLNRVIGDFFVGCYKLQSGSVPLVNGLQ